MVLRMPLKCFRDFFFANSEDTSHAEMRVCLNPVMSFDLNVMCPV